MVGPNPSSVNRLWPIVVTGPDELGNPRVRATLHRDRLGQTEPEPTDDTSGAAAH